MRVRRSPQEQHGRAANLSQMPVLKVGRFVDLTELLVSCAQAVARGDVKKASEILQELYQVHGASDKGNGLQRAAHLFCDALVARLGGGGGGGRPPI
ncbi:hypothetical protein L7F22_036267 [Adiantum nelumboides]|nr:hypothetical protein [Adiantum nelumboides]